MNGKCCLFFASSLFVVILLSGKKTSLVQHDIFTYLLINNWILERLEDELCAFLKRRFVQARLHQGPQERPEVSKSTFLSLKFILVRSGLLRITENSL